MLAGIDEGLVVAEPERRLQRSSLDELGRVPTTLTMCTWLAVRARGHVGGTTRRHADADDRHAVRKRFVPECIASIEEHLEVREPGCVEAHEPRVRRLHNDRPSVAVGTP